MKTTTIEMQVRLDPERRKLFLSGYAWAGEETEFCAHGVKTRWTCDDCEEFFSEERNQDERAD